MAGRPPRPRQLGKAAGLREVTECAVLNANYLLAELREHYHQLYSETRARRLESGVR